MTDVCAQATPLTVFLSGTDVCAQATPLIVNVCAQATPLIVLLLAHTSHRLGQCLH